MFMHHIIVGVVIPGGVEGVFASFNGREALISLFEALIRLLELLLDGKKHLHDWIGRGGRG